MPAVVHSQLTVFRFFFQNKPLLTYHTSAHNALAQSSIGRISLTACSHQLSGCSYQGAPRLFSVSCCRTTIQPSTLALFFRPQPLSHSGSRERRRRGRGTTSSRGCHGGARHRPIYVGVQEAIGPGLNIRNACLFVS